MPIEETAGSTAPTVDGNSLESVDFDGFAADLAGSITGAEPQDEDGELGDAKAPAKQAAPAGAQTPAVAPPQAPAAGAQTPAGQPPATWKPEVAALWATVPPAVQEEIQRREADIAKFTAKTGEYKSVGEATEKLFQEFAPFINETKVNPWDQTRDLWQRYEAFQRAAPAQKVQMLYALAAEVGIDGSSGPIPQAMPLEVQRLQKELAILKGHVGETTAFAREQRSASMEAELNAFAADAEAHPYFWDLSSDIADLYRNGHNGTLQQAYEKALWGNPLTRAKEVDRQSRERETARAAEAKKKAEDARKASRVNVRTSTPGRGNRPPAGSWDTSLDAAYDAIAAKDG